MTGVIRELFQIFFTIGHSLFDLILFKVHPIDYDPFVLGSWRALRSINLLMVSAHTIPGLNQLFVINFARSPWRINIILFGNKRIGGKGGGEWMLAPQRKTVTLCETQESQTRAPRGWCRGSWRQTRQTTRKDLIKAVPDATISAPVTPTLGPSTWRRHFTCLPLRWWGATTQWLSST